MSRLLPALLVCFSLVGCGGREAVDGDAMLTNELPGSSGPAAKLSGSSADRAADLMALANRSGCLACHEVDNKLIGPSWRQVAERYRGQVMRARLIAKVKLGGTGNWTEITGGIPMPPNSPRVRDADIEKLVDYILSLS